MEVMCPKKIHHTVRGGWLRHKLRCANFDGPLDNLKLYRSGHVMTFLGHVASIPGSAQRHGAGLCTQIFFSILATFSP
jgi:hypothetical protein